VENIANIYTKALTVGLMQKCYPYALLGMGDVWCGLLIAGVVDDCVQCCNGGIQNARPMAITCSKTRLGRNVALARMRSKKIDRAWLNAPDMVKEKGGNVTMHTLHHSYASKPVNHGISLFEVSVLPGHPDLKMTRWYAHLAPNDASRKAAGIINFLHA
jgi:hypothetical protein